MLDLALIRAEPARVKAALARRGVAPEAVDALADLDARSSARLEVREALRHRRRRASEEIALAKREARHTANLERQARQVSDELAAVEAEVADLESRRDRALLDLPNLPMTDVPDGRAPPLEPAAGLSAEGSLPKAEAAGDVESTAGAPPWPKPFPPLAHWDLMEILGLVHTTGLAPGRGFVMWRGRGARLVRALVDFLLDLHTRQFGYEEVRGPAIATRASLTGSGHLPTLEGRMYAVDECRVGAPHPRVGDGANGFAPAAGAPGDFAQAPAPPHACLFLAPRAEPHLANLHAGEVLEAEALPIRHVSAGPAFRREAGSAGTASRGLLRLHEFDTAELYTFCRPDQTAEELDRAVRAAETAMERLEVPHRRRLRPARDLSHAAAKTVDLEVWAHGMKEWLCVAALSTFTDYQARRTATRFRDGAGRPRLVHTVGGAAVALPRLIAALLEGGQESGGTVNLPAALAPYMGGEASLTVSAGA